MSNWQDYPCKEWTGALTKGYGRVWDTAKKKVVYVHRKTMEDAYGPSDLDVCHECDNPKCYELRHLRYGTVTSNLNDIKRNNRVYRKINQETADLIRASSGRHVDIGRQHGVSKALVQKIKAGHQWQNPI